MSAICPPSAPFFGAMGAASALIFSCLGSAYGSAKAGIGVAQLGILAPEKIMRAIVPVVMAGILGIYGLIVGILILTGIEPGVEKGIGQYGAFQGYIHLGAGLSAGMASLAAGLTIGIVGDSSVRAYARQDRVFVAMVLMLIFAEALGLYGLIVALLMNQKAGAFNVRNRLTAAMPILPFVCILLWGFHVVTHLLDRPVPPFLSPLRSLPSSGDRTHHIMVQRTVLCSSCSFTPFTPEGCLRPRRVRSHRHHKGFLVPLKSIEEPSGNVDDLLVALVPS